MLNKLKSLNYQFGNDGNITQITVGFNDYQDDVQGNLTVNLKSGDGDLESLTPKQLQELARDKALRYLEKENEEVIVEE